MAIRITLNGELNHLELACAGRRKRLQWEGAWL